MTAMLFIAELNEDVVYESTKSPNNFGGQKRMRLWRTVP